MKLFLFTTDPDLARAAEEGGVYSLIVDWENQGKYTRQAGQNFEINTDTPADVIALKKAVKLPITVRVNGLNEHSSAEIDLALNAGADIIMLPMARSAAEVESFLHLVNHRAKTLVQIETLDLIEDLRQFAQLPWDFAYIGLNDLMISRGGQHIWEALVDGTVEQVCAQLRGREYGFGGTTVVDGGKPLPFQLLLHEYNRLGCSISLMRRTFRREVQNRDVATEIKKIRAAIQSSLQRDSATVVKDHEKLSIELAKLNKKVILVMYSSHEVSPEHLKHLKQIAPEYEVVVVTSEMEAQLYAPRAEIILGHRYLRQTLPYTKSLVWVQVTASGVDQLPLAELQQKQVRLTRSTLSSPVIAEHAYQMYRSLLTTPVTARNKIALIVGFGHIGQEIAKVLKRQSHFTVWAIKQHRDKKSALLADTLFTHDNWKQHLSEVDVLFLSLPHTSKTFHFLSKELLDKLSPQTIIINVGRGETIDEGAVIQLLKDRKIAGFGTDVRGPYLKSLPDLTNLTQSLPFIFTHHSAAKYDNRGVDIEKFAEQQLSAYLKGEKLQNEVIYSES